MVSVERKALIIMPFGKSPEEKLNSRLIYDHIIAPALSLTGAVGHRIDSERLLQTPISAAIEQHLQSADLVIADLSGNNPNVLFELGYRKAHGKPFICVSSKPESAAFWPSIFQIIDYTPPDAINKIAEAINSAFTDYRVRPSIEDELATLGEVVRDKDRFTNPFQDRVAAWRIFRSREQVESIQKGDWGFEAKSTTSYVAYMFEGIMNLLVGGEEYYTITNLTFWSDKAVGDSAFLEANIQAAIRGVNVRRVFLIDEKSWSNPSDRKNYEIVLREHEDASNEINKVDPGRMIVKCILSRDFGTDLKVRYGHFGLARHIINKDGRDDGALLIVPNYAPDGTIAGLKLIFSRGPTASERVTLEYYDKFKRAFLLGKDIPTLLAAREEEVHY
jgi:hypothetical protein